jgi:hypothetical protein
MAIRCRLLSSWRTLLVFAAATLILGSPPAVSAEEESTITPAAAVSDGATSYLLEEAQPSAAADDPEAEQDPWEAFNEPMFRFNRQVDKYVVKPIATGWDFVLPDMVQRGLHNAFDNIRVVPRFVNNLLQLKWHGAGREVARFTLNSSIGLAGLVDVAKDGFGIQQSDEDFGQTLGVWVRQIGPLPGSAAGALAHDHTRWNRPGGGHRDRSVHLVCSLPGQGRRLRHRRHQRALAQP